MKSFFGVCAIIFGVLAAILLMYLFTAKAYEDYGWLGVLVFYTVGLGFIPILPFVAFFLFSANAVAWLWTFIIFGFSCYKASENGGKWSAAFSMLGIAMCAYYGVVWIEAIIRSMM